MNRRGFVVFYLNISEHISEKMTLDEYINLVRKQNLIVVERLSEEGYESMFVPCFNEACRVDKFDIQPKGEAV